MSAARFTLRPFLPRDYPAELEIDVEIEPTVAVSVDELRHQDEILDRQPDHLNLKIVAESSEDARVVAYGALAQPDFNFHPTKYWIWVGVRTAFRGLGIGAALYAVLEMEARARRASTLWAMVREQDLRAASFAERRGFLPQRRTWFSKLDLRTADLNDPRSLGPKLEAQGIRFSTLKAEGSNDRPVRQKVFGLSQRCSQDTPRLGVFHPATFEQFQEAELDNTLVMPEAYFLAIHGDEYVGLSSLQHDQIRSDTLRVGFTGTHPGYRGRGVATELKRRAAQFARDAGYHFIVTGNDSTNQPILAVNQRMGFRAEIVWVGCEKALPPSA